MAFDVQSRSERDALDILAMKRICAGEDAAVADLYDRHAPMALGLALKILRDAQEAEDVVHDAFVAIVERADQYKPERGTVVAWLVTTGRSLSLDRTRRTTRRPRSTG